MPPPMYQYTAPPGYAGFSRDDGTLSQRSLPLEGNRDNGVGLGRVSPFSDPLLERTIGAPLTCDGAGDYKSRPQLDGYEYRTGADERRARSYDAPQYRDQYHQSPPQTTSEEYNRSPNGQPVYYITRPPPAAVYYGSQGSFMPMDAPDRSRNRNSSRDNRSRRERRRSRRRERGGGVISHLRDAM